MSDPYQTWLKWESPRGQDKLREWCADRGIALREEQMQPRGIRFHFVDPADEIRYRQALIVYMRRWMLVTYS